MVFRARRASRLPPRGEWNPCGRQGAAKAAKTRFYSPLGRERRTCSTGCRGAFSAKRGRWQQLPAGFDYPFHGIPVKRAGVFTGGAWWMRSRSQMFTANHGRRFKMAIRPKELPETTENWAEADFKGHSKSVVTLMRGYTLVMDEPRHLGGSGEGPSPMDR